MTSPWGIQVLYRAIVDGREQVAIVRVDDAGTRQKSPQGKILEADHELAPRTGRPQPATGIVRRQVVRPTAGRLFRTGFCLLGWASCGRRSTGSRTRTRSSAALPTRAARSSSTTTASRRTRRRSCGARLEDLRTELFLYGRTWKRRNTERRGRGRGGTTTSRGGDVVSTMNAMRYRAICRYAGAGSTSRSRGASRSTRSTASSSAPASTSSASRSSASSTSARSAGPRASPVSPTGSASTSARGTSASAGRRSGSSR